MAASVLAPSSAHGQDITVLVHLAAPPIVLAPFTAAVIRRVWFVRASEPTPLGLRLLALHMLEFPLWLAAIWFAAVGAVVVVVAALAAIVILNRRLGARDRSWWFSLAFTGVFPAAWLILQVVWYMILVWRPA
jgi:hypothetical protein